MLNALWQSARYRASSLIWVVLSLALALGLVMLVERLRDGVRDGFSQSVANIDLVVGAPAGDVQLLLHSVFQLGAPTQSIPLARLEQALAQPSVEWWVPIALGDNYRGHAVVATQANYFEHLTPNGFSQGQAFENSGQLVMGARVATKLGYSLGQSMSVAHGQAQGLGDQHDQLTFELVGILNPTGGPIDNAVLIDIADFHTLHIDPLRPAPPVAANAALVGVTAPFALFQLQRQLTAEPDLTATLPGVALSRLWSVFGGAERALELLSLALLVCAGLTLLAQTMSQVERRTREMALYHAMGAPLRYSLGLPIVESALIGLVSWAVAWCLLRVASTLISEWLQQSQGILLPQTGVTEFEGALLVCSVIAPVLLSALPHWLAWRRSQLNSLERL